MTLAETLAELGSYHLWENAPELARPQIELALKEDPKLGLAHEDMGFLNFMLGKDQDAVREFTEAVALDPKLYLSSFSLAMMSPMARSSVPADQSAFREALLNVLNQNQQFAPALVQLARLYVRQGDLQRAYGLARRTEQLEPARAGYHLLSGQILLRMGKGAEAANFARYVANRWQGPDHDEAVELWSSVAADQRPAGEPLLITTTLAALATQKAEGLVKSVHCSAQNAEQGQSADQPPGMTVVLDQDGKELRFHSKGAFIGGFSDTLWMGEDHFSFCRHLEGLRAVVRYHKSAGATDEGEFIEFDLRDDLPASPVKPAEAKP
jgi:tetratricopeptide (TPR) repeat protein